MSIDHLGRIRSFLATLPDSIDAFLVVTGDPWGSEYLPDHWALRAHLTGFTGAPARFFCAGTPRTSSGPTPATPSRRRNAAARSARLHEQRRALRSELPEEAEASPWI